MRRRDRAIYDPPLLSASRWFSLIGSIGAAMGATVWIFQDGNLADLFAVARRGRSSASCRCC